MEKRSNFSSKLGFVLAAAGSAVGLGNLWRFPYLAAKYGGGVFLLVYLIFAVSFGFALMIAEIAIGRKTGKSVIHAFSDLNKKYKFIGDIAAIVPIIIFPYYCVIGGWVLKYVITFVTNQVQQAATDTYFSDFIATPAEPVILLVIFMFLTFIFVVLGVEKGIEKASKIMMPLLIVISVIVTVIVLMQPGAVDGVIYYLKPDFSHFSGNTILAALGQLFYSMSLAMGIMVTYGSYMKKENDIEKSVRQIEIFDTAIAFMAGLMIVPSVFAFSGGDPSVLSSGPGLMFVTLPKVFASTGSGMMLGILFFVLVLFAALTSSISLMETIVSIVMDRLKVKRLTACIGVFALSLILGIPSALGFSVWSEVKVLGMQILDMFDFASNSIIMPIVALLTCIFVGYIIKPKAIVDEVKQSGEFKSEKLFVIVIKYIAPLCLIAILVSSILNALGIIKL